MIPTPLTENQVRVLGALIEKQITTPMNYPMTPNSIRVACNQKSNRDPVVEFDDDVVFDTLQSLKPTGYLESGLLDSTQTVKYRQALTKTLGLDRAATAVLCELFLRGPQTPGELRSRADRMHPFSSLAEVEKTLAQLASQQFVLMLERQPGTKESRWGHLFAGKPVFQAPSSAQAAATPRKSDLEDRVAQLEALVSRLEARLDALEGR